MRRLAQWKMDRWWHRAASMPPRARLIEDAPVAELELPTDVHVLGDRLGGPVADLVDGTAPETGADPGDRIHPPQQPLGALDHADDGRELADLNAGDQGRAVEHP